MSLVDFSKPVLLAIVLCGWVSLKLAAAAPGEIRNLGTLGDDWRSGCLGVNASGQVAGFSDSFDRRAVIYTGWPGNGTMIDLGIPPGSMVTAINASGQMAGMGPTVIGAIQAFRYTGTPGLGGVKHDLGTIGGTPGASQGMAINDSGQVAGFSDIPGGPREHAFRYTGTPGVDGVMHDLGTLGGTYSTGYGINSSGQVVGHSGTTNGQTHAFLYNGTPGSGGFMRDLGTLGGSGSGAYAVNSKGQVVGNSALEGDVIAHAFLYTGTPGSGGVMHDLDTLGGSYSIAWAVNSFGQVVGQSDVAGAFLYTGTPGVDGLMIDLNAWLDIVNPNEGAKWSLHEAVGITDNGLIAGNGYYDDGTVQLGEGFRAFLLDASSLLVPEPSCIVLFGFAVPAMLCLRRRPTLPRAARAAPVFAMVSLLLVQTSRAGVIATPPGLVQGDKFRIAFVSSASLPAGFTNIADYDQFISNSANIAGLTYNGNAVPWQVIGSTATVNAVDPARLPLTSAAGIYRVDGVKVADNAMDLWDWSLDAPIVLDEFGATRVSLVWTGTGPSGGTYLALGEEEVSWGNSPSNDANWMTVSSSFNTTPLSMYGISAELSVLSIPEPCTHSMCGIATLVGLIVYRQRSANRDSE